MIVFAMAMFACLATAAAHELRPLIATLTFDGDGGYELALDANLEAILADIGPEHDDTDDAPTAEKYNGLRALPPEMLAEQFSAFAPQWLARLGFAFDGTVATPAISDIEVPPVGDTDLARESVVRLSGRVPEGAGKVDWSFSENKGSSVLRIERPGQELQAQFFGAGAASQSFD
ncbi:MAG: hypothetical protein AAGF28_11795, partial [Pseudomonadota bacterium]